MRKLDTGENTNIIVNEYPKDCYIPISNPGTCGKRVKYLNTFGCFDIETSNHEKVSTGGQSTIFASMFSWQYCEGDNRIYYGRTWKDLQALAFEMKINYGLTKNRRLVWYIHNLAFEFQFLRSVFNITEVFATDIRKPVRCLINDCIELRCSYRMTNMSLEKFCETSQTGYLKITGYDYDKERFQDDEISDFDMLYGVMDVYAMHKAICKALSSENDTLASVPMTSTGYVRREARQHIDNSVNRPLLYRTALDEHQYKMCKAATRGGDAHANVLYIGEVLHNVWSYDRSSSYPHIEVTEDRFPITAFINERNPKSVPSNMSVIMLVEFRNMRLKPMKYMTYLPFSRALKVIHPKYNDNGRVIACEVYIGVITEIDYEIICEEYDFDDPPIYHEMMIADRGKLPKAYREYVMELYIRKCELKKGDPYFYDKFKNKLNATFGMMLTDITREEILYTEGQWKDAILPDIPEALKKYYNNPKSFLVYQHGLYITALARLALRESIKATGIDTVYVDTDSNKHIGDHRKDFAELNSKIHAKNIANDIVPIVSIGGRTYEMGIWEDEGNGNPKYAEFITQGAKKYAYRYYDSGKFGVTVAGLNKEKGAKLLQEKGDLSEFQAGLTFDPTYAGRLTAKYDDEIRLKEEVVKGHHIEVTSNVALIPTTYNLSLEKKFAIAVKDIQNGECPPVDN